MKKFFSIVATLLLISSASFSQTVVNDMRARVNETVTINIVGNRTKQIAVDGRSYTINNTEINGEQDVVINDLTEGQHSLDIVRNNNNRNNTTRTNFTLRDGYNLTINISSNGSVTISETRSGRNGNGNGNGGAAISTAAFNKLYAAERQKISSTQRAAFLENEFVNTNKRFTSKQASQLIQLVNSESLRFKLAKLSYTNITDKENFSQVRNLLYSNSNKNNLDTYIATLPNDGDDDMADNNEPLTNEKFVVIVNEVQSEYSQNDRNYYLTNFFNKDYNYYTSSQAKQLIQLVNAEQQRFELSKLAYRGVIDRENYGEVVQLVYTSSNRAALRSYIASYDVNNTKPAMTSTEFNRLYQSAYNQNTTTTRYNAVNTSFTTSGNYFTAAQARQLIQLVNNETNRLQLAKTAYRVLVDKTNYAQLNDLFSLQSNRNDWNSYVSNYNNSYGNYGVAMNATEYNKIYRSVSDAWSASSRYSIESTAFQTSTNYFTTAQVRQLLQLISSESDRLTLAKGSYDNIVDQENFSQVYDLFNSTASRNELSRFVGSNGGTTTMVAMSDAEFNNIARDIQSTFGIGAKMSSLTNTFNTETYYFTVQQTKQLIQMVSLESNRVELAKLAYNNLTDPQNFTQLYDLFANQSSKDELNAYISNAYLNR